VELLIIKRLCFFSFCRIVSGISVSEAIAGTMGICPSSFRTPWPSLVTSIGIYESEITWTAVALIEIHTGFPKLRPSSSAELIVTRALIS